MELVERSRRKDLALDHFDLSSTGAGGDDARWRDTQLRVQFDAWLF